MDSEDLLENISSISTLENPKKDDIERSKVGMVLESGRQAPSPGNVQSKEFIVVENKFKKERLANIVDDVRIERSPTVILVLTDNNRMKRRVGSEFDRFAESEATTAVQNMRLMAQGVGLSTAWLDGFDSESARSLFEIPESHSVRSLLCLAYAESEKEIKPKFGMNETTFYDEFGNQVASQFDQLHWRGVREESRIASKKANGTIAKIRRKLTDIF